jgi:tetratricopeptide (TPR) repeat protein
MILSLLPAGQAVFAQAITLKSGQRVETLGLRRERDVVMGKVQVGTGSGEVGYNVSQIAKIEFPQPAALKTALDLLGQRQPEKALIEINRVVSYYEPFKDVPGGWWSQAALIKISVLAALHKDADAEALAALIQKTVTDPNTVRAVQVRLSSGLIRKKDFEKAIEICDAAIKESTDPEVLADAWIHKGDALAGMKDWDEALLAYLHVPVFYHTQTTYLPPALLGSARAYARLEDAARARRSFDDLIAAYPNSPEAAAAKTDLQKIKTP